MADREARRRIKELAARVEANEIMSAYLIADHTKLIDSLDANLAQARGELTKLSADLAAEKARVDSALAQITDVRGEAALALGQAESVARDLAGLQVTTNAIADELGDLVTRVEALEGNDQPDPPDEPTGWTLRKTLAKRTDWKAILIENFRGATITDRPSGGLTFSIPNAQSVGTGRVEVQEAPLGVEGEELAYEWQFRIPNATVLSTTADKENLIQQGHGNQQAGFTSGTSIDQATEQIKVKVKGGHETSTAGSHRYEYEDEFVFGRIERDIWHTVRLEVHWHRSDGYFRARLDNDPWMGVTDKPTWPLGDHDGVPTENIMFRLGWYPSQGRSYGPMLMETGPLNVYERAA